MITDIIEYKRKQLYETIGLNPISSEAVLAASQELERFMNFHAKVKLPRKKSVRSQSYVHANAIENILDVARQEKLSLPFELNSASLFEYAEWFRIDFVDTLLKAVGDRYGHDALAYIGEFVPMRCIFPETIQSFQEALQHLNSIFHLNHKSSFYIGEYLPYMDVKSETVLFCHTPDYPAAFNFGIINGLAKKFNHSIHMKELDLESGGQFKILG